MELNGHRHFSTDIVDHRKAYGYGVECRNEARLVLSDHCSCSPPLSQLTRIKGWCMQRVVCSYCCHTNAAAFLCFSCRIIKPEWESCFLLRCEPCAPILVPNFPTLCSHFQGWPQPLSLTKGCHPPTFFFTIVLFLLFKNIREGFLNCTLPPHVSVLPAAVTADATPSTTRTFLQEFLNCSSSCSPKRNYPPVTLPGETRVKGFSLGF